MSINKDQVKGRVEEVKGTIKEATGKIVGNPTLEAKGNIEKNLGKAQAKIGDVREDLKKAAK
ncbi:MAG: CsbD family protein [Steroidobacterales bacterium]